MTEADPRVGRRALLGWTGSAGVLGLAAGAAGGAALAGHAPAPTRPASLEESDPLAAARLAPAAATIRGHDLPMGLSERVPAFGTMIAFDLTDHARSTTARARATAIAFLRELARIADAQPDRPDPSDPSGTGAAAYDLLPASVQVTPGLGASLLVATGLEAQRPAAFVDLPAFATDRLDPALCGGDLMVQVGAEDPMRLAGAVQEVLSSVRGALGDLLRVRWSRSGFRNTAAASESPKTTSRNIMGHRDGTDNPPLASPLWRLTVQAGGHDWMGGGSYVVARRIRIDLDSWFSHPEAARDRVIGRHTSDGAALGEGHEHDPVILTKLDKAGHPTIPAHAHIRLANPTNVDGARIYRRSWSFDDGYVGGRRESGLLFLAWQADVRRGFLPIQKALVDHHDALNDFTTHIGSAVFAVPARSTDDYVGQRLLEA